MRIFTYCRRWVLLTLFVFAVVALFLTAGFPGRTLGLRSIEVGNKL